MEQEQQARETAFSKASTYLNFKAGAKWAAHLAAAGTGVIFVALLIVLWLLGMVSSYTLGGFIHILLIIAIAVILIRVIQGRRVV